MSNRRPGGQIFIGRFSAVFKVRISLSLAKYVMKIRFSQSDLAWRTARRSDIPRAAGNNRSSWGDSPSSSNKSAATRTIFVALTHCQFELAIQRCSIFKKTVKIIKLRGVPLEPVPFPDQLWPKVGMDIVPYLSGRLTIADKQSRFWNHC